MKHLGMTDTKLIVIMVNKRINAKVFQGDSMRLNNP